MCAIIFVEVRCQMAATSTFICCHCLLFCSFLRWCKTPRAEQRPPETIKVSCYMHFLPSVSVLWKMCMAMHFSCKLRSEPEPKTWWLLLPFFVFSFGKLKNDKHNHFLGLGLGPKLLFCLTNEILRKLVHIAHIMLCQIIVPIAHAILSVVSRKNSIIVLPW